MATEVIAAQISRYELAVLAVSAKMYDATAAELAKYAYRLFMGDTPEKAREIALSGRNTPTANPTDHDELIGVRLPEEWIKEVQEKAPEFKNKASFHRYVLARAATGSDEQALSMATRPIGWTKGKLRKQAA